MSATPKGHGHEKGPWMYEMHCLVSELPAGDRESFAPSHTRSAS